MAGELGVSDLVIYAILPLVAFFAQIQLGVELGDLNIELGPLVLQLLCAEGDLLIFELKLPLFRGD